MQVREYAPGEIITTQDVKSMFNLNCLKVDKMMNKLNRNTTEYSKVAADFKNHYDPPISQQWEHTTKANRLLEKQKQMKRMAERTSKGLTKND